MKDYDSENQVGYGQTYEDYLDDLKKIFTNIYNITNEDGSLWIIIDTFKRENQVVPLPFDLAAKLKEIKWLLQDIIIWKKDKTVPWSSNGFMQRKFEYILFLTKSKKFKWNKDKVRTFNPDQLKRWWIKYPERYNPKGKALDEIWEFPIPIQGSWGNKYIRHFCPLPKDMIATMINLSTNEGDIVLDPFAGSGTVLSQSAYMKRRYIGFELNKEYISMFNEYLNKTIKQNTQQYEKSIINVDQEKFEKQILELRALKYGRILLKVVLDKYKKRNLKIFVDIIEKDTSRHKLIKVKYEIVGNTDELEKKLIQQIVCEKPFSKYGITPIFKFLKNKKINSKKYYFYSETNSYSYIKEEKLHLLKGRVVSKIKVDLNENNYL